MEPKYRLDARNTLLRYLTQLVRVYRNVNAEERNRVTGHHIRTQIRDLDRSLKSLLSRFDRDALSFEAETRLASELLPTLNFWLKDLFKEERWLRKLPRDIRYVVNLRSALGAISKGIEAASQPTARERKGGRPQAVSKQQFVEHIARDYWTCLGKSPPTTKGGDFEELVRVCLHAARYVPGRVNALICEAVRNVKAKGPPKLPALSSR